MNDKNFKIRGYGNEMSLSQSLELWLKVSNSRESCEYMKIEAVVREELGESLFEDVIVGMVSKSSVSLVGETDASFRVLQIKKSRLLAKVRDVSNGEILNLQVTRSINH